ncbi:MULTISPECIES: hypothetical protein [unclassified Gordonia (in: high G+C Gram-positive bacteria)]|uniref:TY-Chap domain-containing protein n=1 Tax=unclassified Gordonia (in: high G+C Gram-positive bacteria) TaxID=2657482 RepID=UPI00080E5E48|nr:MULTISPECIES: hypothetical protein [unclassified Gordonia (in: high G+C Gram-positive bacteria)]MBN0973432.1 hypothetical protein [Gordonia sp. BP-119]MBN0985233.1 hypothetical protein [Gordonia sp. BP-94]OCH80839.1 hypothetical protein A9310_05585 [Gordonia sp. UCD-TK1]
MTDFTVDSNIDDAWRTFALHVGDRLSHLEPGETLTIQQDPAIPEGPHGAMRFSVTGSRRLRCTIEDTDLHPTPEYFAEHLDLLAALGWRRLRNGTHIFEVGRRRVDQLAHTTVLTLRQVWEVVHPAFLDHSPAARPEPQIEVAVQPFDADHLRALLVGSLEDLTGCRIQTDADGDIALPTKPVSSWLSPRSDAPRFEFFARLAGDITDRRRAADIVAAQPTMGSAVRVHLLEDEVFATLTVECAVFHPHNLSSALAEWFTFLADCAPSVIAKVGEDAPLTARNDGRFPDALQTLLELDPDGRSLSAREVAKICRYSQADILSYINTSEEQHLTWRRSAVDAAAASDPAEADACRHEAEAWKATTHNLRAALRVVVLSDDDAADRSSPAK